MQQRNERPNRARARGLAAVELAALLSLGACLTIVAVPVLAARFRASRFAEAVEGLDRIGKGALAHAATRPATEAFPPSAPLTPATPPRGKLEEDPPDLWSTPPWQALGFRAAPEGVPHAYAFSFEASATKDGSRFVARAHGDLDGDGTTSTFELTGQSRGTEPGRASLDPGLYVEAEAE